MNPVLISKIKKIFPQWFIRPIINIIRIINFIFRGATKDIMSLHDMYLLNQEYRFNKERELLNLYGDKSVQKILFKSKEIKLYSQNGEDGLLLFLFDQIGTKSKYFIEIGAGGETSNTLNLALNFGWKGAFIDGDIDQLNITKKQFENSGSSQDRFKYIDSFIKKNNINDILDVNNVPNDIDLLSIDIDGNDYWIWDSMNNVKPRVVIIEYNASLGYKESMVMKHNDDHSKYEKHPLGWYHGASLKAFEKLGKKKGYSLVCCDSLGVNAFFVRNDLLNDKVKAIGVENCIYSHQRRDEICSPQEQYNQIINLGFEKV
jgi:hypothetical protein